VECLDGVDVVLREDVGAAELGRQCVDTGDLDQVEAAPAAPHEVSALGGEELQLGPSEEAMGDVVEAVLDEFDRHGVELDAGHSGRAITQGGEDIATTSHADDQHVRARFRDQVGKA
jgi:hypothetical protein